MFSSSVARLTKQLTHLSVGRLATTATSPRIISTVPSKSFATKINDKDARRLKIQAKKKKNVNKPAASAADDDDASNEDAFSQSEEWIKFQNSITGDSSQAGQGKKSRGGKKARRKREEELAKLEQDTEDASMRFPALRYSEEETEALLKQAYAALPERTGKRGTRNLWRQKNRWKAVRRIRYKYKQNLIAAHERRMEKRHWKREKVKEMKAGAPKTREKDLDYQAEVLRRWAATMFADVGALSDDVEGTDTETEEEAKVMASTKE